MRPYVVRIEAQEIERSDDSSVFAVYLPNGSTKFIEIAEADQNIYRSSVEDVLYHFVHQELRYESSDEFADFRLDIAYL